MYLRVSYIKKIWKNLILFASFKPLKKWVEFGVGFGSGPGSKSQWWGSGSAPKCHGSPTLPVISLSTGTFLRQLFPGFSLWWATRSLSACTRPAPASSSSTSSPTPSPRRSISPASLWSSSPSASSRSSARTCRRWWCRCRTAPPGSGVRLRPPAFLASSRWPIRQGWKKPEFFIYKNRPVGFFVFFYIFAQKREFFRGFQFQQYFSVHPDFKI